jgi:hypothetical protein
MKVDLNRPPSREASVGPRLPSSQMKMTAGGGRLRISPKTGRRRPVMVVASVVVVATCSTLFAMIYLHSSRLVAVIGVTRLVPQGQLVQAADLRQIDISLVVGVDLVPVSSARQVIGQRAAVTLLAGTLLSPSDIGGSKRLSSSQAVVGVDLKPGMLPAEGVEPGEHVLVVLTGPAGSAISAEDESSPSDSATSTTVTPSGSTATSQPEDSGSNGSSESTAPSVISSAIVVAVDTNPDDSGTGDVVVSVEVPTALAPIVADSSAAGQAALVQIGGSA